MEKISLYITLKKKDLAHQDIKTLQEIYESHKLPISQLLKKIIFLVYEMGLTEDPEQNKALTNEGNRLFDQIMEIFKQTTNLEIPSQIVFNLLSG